MLVLVYYRLSKTYNAAATINSELFMVSNGNTTKYAIFVKMYSVAVVITAAADALGRFLIGSFSRYLISTQSSWAYWRIYYLDFVHHKIEIVPSTVAIHDIIQCRRIGSQCI